jgi:hypothetical protein
MRQPPGLAMHFVSLTHDQYALAILDIFSEAIYG